MQRRPPFHLRVECYDGYKAEQRPVCFYLGERRFQVQEILDQWYGPDYISFRVRADDGDLYILRHTDKGSQDLWTLESFRASQSR